MVAQPNYGLSTDTTLGGNSPSDIISPSEKAIKTYVDTKGNAYVTTDTEQDISGRKTFLGEKAIYFKQSATTDKLGFTLFNTGDTELGALEWRPDTVSGKALLALNCPQSGSNYVGFRYWSNLNIVAPRPSTNGTYFIPTHLTDGTTTVTANNNGVLNIGSLIPSVGDGTITFTQGGVTKGTITTNQSTNTTIELDSGGGTVDQVFDPESENAQSGVAIAGELENYQEKLIAGKNITIAEASDWSNTQVISNLNEVEWNCLTYGNGKFLASGVYDGSICYMSTSVDGEEWTTPTDMGYISVESLAFDGTRFLRIQDEESIYSSTDGSSWTLFCGRISPDLDIDWNELAYGNGIYAAAGYISSLGYYAFSSDGINWSTPESSFSPGVISDHNIAYGNNKFIRLGESGDVYYSDGASWNVVSGTSLSSSYGDWKYVTYDGTKFIAVSYNASSRTSYYSTSVDGLVWDTPVENENLVYTKALASDGVRTVSIGYEEPSPWEYEGHVSILPINPSLVISASGGAWGEITGTLSNQTDLANALNAKQDTLVSGTNIKTINSTSLLGNGNIAVQPTLVSGTNIKTINNESLLGSGNISVSAETAWGDITGTLSNQTDLSNVLATKITNNSPKSVNGVGILSSYQGSDGYGIAIGYDVTSSSPESIAIGHESRATWNNSIAIGHGAAVSGISSIAIGLGASAGEKQLAIGFGNSTSYVLLEGSGGLIPDARISSNIARTSDIPDISDYYNKTETDALLDEKQDNITNLNAGYGINIYDYYPDAVIPDYHAINSSQQYVSYSVADPTAWVSTRLENPRGIAITDVLDNIATGAFEYVALIPYVDGVGLGLKLSWDSDFSVINYTDGLFISPASTETSLTSSLFSIGGSNHYKTTNDISLTNEQYIQIQEQGGIWFKITSDGAGNYNSYYSFDNSAWVEIIFNDNSKFSPEHTPERPCIGCSNKYNPTATFNLETVTFSFTPARDPYIKIGVDESVLPVITDTYNGTSHDGMSGVAVASAISDKADKATTLSGYGITDAYTKTEIDGIVSSVYKPAGSVAFASLPTLSENVLGNVYNVTDAFTTTSDFIEGAGKSYPAGTNVVVIEPTSGTYKFDVLAGFVDLSGYVPTSRTINNKALTGDITLSASDVGALPDSTAIPTKISDLTDDTATNPIDKADTLTGLTATVAELNYVDGVTSAIQTQLDGKQATLVSGTNIKTINNESLLGSGNVSTTQVIIRDWA